MKTIFTSILLAIAISTPAALYQANQTFSGGAIEAGNPTGTKFTGVFDQAVNGDLVGGVTVSFNLSGGYNGDLYAYLIAPNGTLVVLLNQPGTDAFGSSASGFGNGTANSFVLSTTGATSIQNENGTTGQPVTGTYQAAGNLNYFGTIGSPGGSVNGNWTLYFADLGSGGGTPTLDNWSLSVTAVPELVNVALIFFAASLLARPTVKWIRKQASQRRYFLVPSATKKIHGQPHIHG